MVVSEMNVMNPYCQISLFQPQALKDHDWLRIIEFKGKKNILRVFLIFVFLCNHEDQKFPFSPF